MTSNERRNALLEILSMRRFETLENLAFEFGVSKRTIRYDIEILSLTYPIYTVQGNGGGIHVDENYRLGKSYLKKDQQELLERLLQNLNGKDATTMREIIKTFGLKGV
ncbi:helix-turn-helix type 11 containing protein [Corallococcus sp. CAG:1435]|nr:helix-turn-helix type 11 containing protein [Corallococcus sp. CAG:1435]